MDAQQARQLAANVKKSRAVRAYLYAKMEVKKAVQLGGFSVLVCLELPPAAIVQLQHEGFTVAGPFTGNPMDPASYEVKW